MFNMFIHAAAQAAANSGGGGGGGACAPTLETPGELSGFGAVAMSVSGLVATSAASLSAAQTPARAKAAGNQAVVLEVHYDPADFAASGGSNGVALGDLVAGTAAEVILSGATGQANSALAFVSVNDGANDLVLCYDSGGSLVDFANADALTDIALYFYSDTDGASATFVTDPADFVVDLSGLYAGKDLIDYCGNSFSY